jgi:hypothetical protein
MPSIINISLPRYDPQSPVKAYPLEKDGDIFLCYHANRDGGCFREAEHWKMTTGILGCQQYLGIGAAETDG